MECEENEENCQDVFKYIPMVYNIQLKFLCIKIITD